MASKIEKAGVLPLAIKFMEDGMTEEDIAQALSAHCADSGILDSDGRPFTFSQSAINRGLKTYKNRYREKARMALDRHVDDQIESDLAVIEEAEKYHVGVARDKEQPHKVRSDAWMRAAKLVFEKIKASLEGSGDEDVAEMIAAEVRKTLNPKLKEKLDAIGTRTGIARISGSC